MKKGTVYIDSGAFIAFLVRRDGSHKDMVRLFAHPPRSWYTSVLVISEAYSWFLHSLGEESARKFRHLLSNLSGLKVLDVDSEHRTAVWAKLDDLRGRKLTYVDASSLVWIKEKAVRKVWGTDHHLGIEGTTVVPGPPLL
ncbi:MAG: type II toxin-antitoxin system VapC family toxin [Gemmatimonadota bacterium]